jgi:hypothetical protein
LKDESTFIFRVQQSKRIISFTLNNCLFGPEDRDFMNLQNVRIHSLKDKCHIPTTGIFSNTNVVTSNFTQQKLHIRSNIIGAYSTTTKPPSIILTHIVPLICSSPKKLPKFVAFEVRYRH